MKLTRVSLLACVALTSCKPKPATAPDPRPADPIAGPIAEAAAPPADLCGSVMKIVDAGDDQYDFSAISGRQLHASELIYESTVVLPGASACTLFIDEGIEASFVSCEMSAPGDPTELEARRLELIDALTPCFAAEQWASAEHAPTTWRFTPLDAYPTRVQVMLTNTYEGTRLIVDFDNGPAE